LGRSDHRKVSSAGMQARRGEATIPRSPPGRQGQMRPS
jgi:hypothetical protein